MVFLALLGALGSTYVLGAPKAEPWPRWQAHDPESSEQVDHRVWGMFLDRYLVAGQDGQATLLRYARVSADDRKLLKRYLDSLSRVPVSGLNRAEQKAYWINLYNALTVATVLHNYPIESIRSIKSGWFKPGPWDLSLIRVEGVELSLNDIEHRILRPIWQDERVHYAVNCASIGCPNLQPEAFTGVNTERLLGLAANEYVNSSRGVHFSAAGLVVSSLYDWYLVDFGGSETGLISHLLKYAGKDLAERLKHFNGKLTYAYDWSLNEAQ